MLDLETFQRQNKDLFVLGRRSQDVVGFGTLEWREEEVQTIREDLARAWASPMTYGKASAFSAQCSTPSDG